MLILSHVVASTGERMLLRHGLAEESRQSMILMAAWDMSHPSAFLATYARDA
jgi:hypothetical protein